MSNEVKTITSHDKVLEILASGNIDLLTPKEKVEYVTRICESSGLNPLTRPFEWLRLQGRTVLYASKGCADQLRKVNNISIKITEKKIEDGVLFVTVEGQDKSGRIDCDMGAINVNGLKGDALANAVMKGITKAKRRLTLSMCGLGILDESEFDTLGENALENGIKELEKREETKILIQEKKVILDDKIENEQERDATISIIKAAMGVLTSHMTKIEEKGKALVDLCGVRKFDDLKTKTLDELKAISAKLNDLQKEQLLRESTKVKTAKNASFKLENP